MLLSIISGNLVSNSAQNSGLKKTPKKPTNKKKKLTKNHKKCQNQPKTKKPLKIP